jgi:alpha-mannosidase
LKTLKTYQLLIWGLLIVGFSSAQGQKAWFADGYHGGVYGHYPMWQASFMVSELTKNPGWSINLEIEPETWDTVSVKDAENFKRFQDYYAQKGRFGRIEFVNPAYAQPYAYNISGESLIRQFRYGIDKTLEYFPQATFTTYSCEEPCFTSSLPQILKGFGYQYAVIRNPNTCWGGYTSGFGKDLVNWIGPDGTSLLSVPRYACEDLLPGSTWQTESWSNSNAFIQKCFDNGVKYPVGMTFQDAGWNGGSWGNQYKPTEYTTWTAYIDMIKEKVEADDWKFSQEDIKPGLMWGAPVLQKLSQEIRVSEKQVVMGEKMASLEYLFTGKVWPAADFAEAWRTLMLAQHHDCWIVPYNGKPGHTWADNVSKWTDSTNKIAADKIEGLFVLESVIENKQKYIRVFNTLGNTRTGIVEVGMCEGLNTEELAVLNEEGKILLSQISTDDKGSPVLLFEATVPAMGYATFILDKQKAKNKALTNVNNLSNGALQVETEYYVLTFDPNKGGAISSWIDKKAGNRQLVQEGKALNSLKGYFYKEEKFYKSTDLKADVSIKEQGPLLVRILIENKIGQSNYTQCVTLLNSQPRVDFSLHIDWHGQPGIGAYDQTHNYKAEEYEKAFYNDLYKLHLKFPFRGVGERLFKNAPFDVCETRLNNTIYSSWDSIKHNVILNWVDVANHANNYGVALFVDHTTSYLQTDELPLGLTVQYTGKALWGRDYRIHEPTNMHYSLLPHKGNWEHANVEYMSSDWNEPFIAQFILQEGAQKSRSLLEVKNKNLHLSSVTISNKDLLVRIYSTSFKSDGHEIQWNGKVDKIELVDLNGKVTESVEMVKNKNGTITTRLNIPQFGFRTLKLTNASL